MIDERTLEQLLAEAAEEIEVPVDGAARIEAAAGALERRPSAIDDADGHRARASRVGPSLRLAAVAASVLVLGVIGVTALWHVTSGSTPRPSAIRHLLAPRAASRSLGAAQKAAAAPAYGAAGEPMLSPAPVGAGSGVVLPPQAHPPGSDVGGQKIESTGSMNLQVRHLDPAVAALTSLVAGDGGYVAAEETQSASDGAPASGTVTLEVPQTSFSTLIEQVKRLGVASAVSTKQVDVTGQYVDLQAQITALKATQSQYLTIMTRAQSIGDILAVQQQLNSIDSQLQQVEGELHLLDSQTADGTLTVDLSEPGPKPAPPPKPAPKPPTGLAAAWGSARHGFADGIYWVVRQTGGLAFLVLLAGLLYLLGRIGRRGLRRLAL